MMRFCQGMLGAPPEHWPRLARAAEAAGFDSVAVADHVFQPRELKSEYPYTPDGTPMFSEDEQWPDPWVIVGAMAAVTTQLRFLTNVYVLPLRNVFVVAKAVGTAAFLSGNRVGLGVGAGWMREEFDQLGQTFSRRGRRMEEMIEVLRALWAGGYTEFHGEFHDFPALKLAPVPTEPVPIYIGGHSDIALDRAARIGDGWLGIHYEPEELLAICTRLREQRERAGTLDRPFEIIASPMAAPRPELVERLEAAGVTTILTSAWMMSGVMAPGADQAEELIGSYGERFIAPLG